MRSRIAYDGGAELFQVRCRALVRLEKWRSTREKNGWGRQAAIPDWLCLDIPWAHRANLIGFDGKGNK
jgi:hypothetical protein